MSDTDRDARGKGRPGWLIPASIACVFAAGIAAAKDYPDKPVRAIVPTAPSASADLLMRVIAPRMSRTLGQPVIVENKPGADQLIAWEYVAKQAPEDGYTVVVLGLDGLALLPVTTKDIRFNPLRDLTPIVGLAEGRYVLRSPAGASWKTFAQMVAHVKANPGKVNYGSSAIQVRFPMLVLMKELGLDMVHIPYASGARYLQAIVAGEIDLGMTGEASLAAVGDRVRVVAVTGSPRLPAYADAPTFAELGFPYVRGPSYGLGVRAGTPAEAIERLATSARSALQEAEIRASLAKMQLEALNEPPELVAKRFAELARFYAEYGRAVGIEPK